MLASFLVVQIAQYALLDILGICIFIVSEWALYQKA